MFFNIPDGSKMILAGKGTDIQKYRDFIDKYFLHYKFEAIADDIGKQRGLYVRGIPVVAYDEYSLFDGIVILFHENWFEESEKLHDQGHVLFRDFIPVWFFELGFQRRTISLNALLRIAGENLETYIKYISYAKKIAFVYGDGNVPNLVRILSYAKQFNDEYVIISSPPAKSISINQYKILKAVWKYVRCLIFQPVNKSKEVTYLNIKELVGKHGKVIKIPPIAFWGYFPQAYVLEASPVVKDEKGNRHNPFTFGDKNIDDGLKDKLNVAQIQEFLEDEDFYSIEFVEEYFNNCLENLKINESGCDVTISEYIANVGKNQRLFDTPTKASLAMVKYVVEQIVNCVGIEKMNYDQKNMELYNVVEMPIYNSVSRKLHLGFDTSNVHCCDEYYGKSLSREEYVEEYIEKVYER